MKNYRFHVVLLCVSGMFYLRTLAPTLIAGDSSSFAVRIHNFSFSELHKLPVGRADNHPVYIVLGKLFSWLPFELAYSLNLMSACWAVLTLLVIFLTIKHLCRSPVAALFGAFSLMVSHAFWQHAVIAEVYTLNAFFVAVLLYLLLTQRTRRCFPLLFPIVVMLGLLNHLILALILPACMLYLLIIIDGKLRKRILLLGGGSMLIVGLVLLVFFLVQPQAMKAWLYAILVGPPPIAHYLFPPSGILPFLGEVLFYLLYLLYQYPLGGVLLGCVGLVQLWRHEKAAAILITGAMLVNGLFFLKTTSWGSYGGTKYTFYISDYTVFAVLIGYGASVLFTGLEQGLKRRVPRATLKWLPSGILVASVGLTALFYSLMPALTTILNVDLLHARTLPYRDTRTFFLNPNKRGYAGDRRFGEEILEKSGKEAVIFADFTPETVLRYLQVVEAKRPDVTLVPCHEKINMLERVEAMKRDRPDAPLYLADNNAYYNLKELETQYQIHPYASFFEIISRK